MDKTCKICEFVGDTSLFIKNRRKCKKCMSNYLKEYSAHNKSLLAKKQKEWREINADDLKIKKKNYYEKNIVTISDKNKATYEANKESIKKRVANYKNNNKSKRNASETNKRNNDPSYKLRVYFSRDISRSVKSKNGLSTFKILPYSVAELRAHLEKQFEPWMNWNNHGKYYVNIWDDHNVSTWTWQIDHIIPRSKFIYLNINDLEFTECWALSNLRPLSSKTNLINGSKLSKRYK
jgi:hypothetical protein